MSKEEKAVVCIGCEENEGNEKLNVLFVIPVCSKCRSVISAHPMGGKRRITQVMDNASYDVMVAEIRRIIRKELLPHEKAYLKAME